MSNDDLIYAHSMTSNAKMYRDYPEYAESNAEMQARALHYKMEDEGYESLSEPVEVRLDWYNLVDHGDDEDGEPVVEMVYCPPEDATYVIRTIECQCRKVLQ
jgi:hypothetical protein